MAPATVRVRPTTANDTTTSRIRFIRIVIAILHYSVRAPAHPAPIGPLGRAVVVLAGNEKRARWGPSPNSSGMGGLDAQARGSARGDQAEEQQEGRGQAVEMTFELQDRHDTHL